MDNVHETVLQETLCLYPPAPFTSRSCIRGHHIGISVGAIILLNTYILHRRERFWARPNEFDYIRGMRDSITDLN